MTDRQDRSEDDDALAAEYVVGVLARPDRQSAEARMRQDADFAARVARWERRLDGLNTDYGALAPPPRVKARIDAVLFGTGPATRWFWQAFGGLVTAAALALVVLFWPGLTPSAPDLRAALGDPGADVQVTVLVDQDRDVLTVALAADGPPEGQVFELWLVPASGAPQSLGIFAADSALPLEAGIALQSGATLAVSVEPPGGSPTGAPTGPVVAAGVLSDA